MTTESKQRARELRDSGLSYRAIGRELGVNARTVAYNLDVREREYKKLNTNTHLKLARKFYWWCRRVHPEWIESYVEFL